ncbi:MAG: metallothionein [Cyanobacteria bacterium P01_F01_bin.150]
MAAITQLKCACKSCLCIVDISSAVQKASQYYCSDACADGHIGGTATCAHTSCGCHN